MPTPIRNEIEADAEVAAYDAPTFSAQPPRQGTLIEPDLPLFTLPEVGEDEELHVEVGDRVTYVDLDEPNNKKSFRIVADGHDPAAGLVNEAKPIAQALLGATEGDVVEIPIENRHTKRFKLLKIERATPSTPA